MFILEESRCCLQPVSVVLFQICQDSQWEEMPNAGSRNTWRRFTQQTRLRNTRVFLSCKSLCRFAPWV